MDKQTTDQGVAATPVTQSEPQTQSANQPIIIKRRRRSTIRYVMIIIIITMVGVVAGMGGAFLYVNVLNKPVTSLTSSYDGNTMTTESEQSIASVAEKVSPSVVSILSTSRSRTSLYSYSSAESQSAGTGIVISKDGYILTNNHVVDGATKVSVVTDDGVTYDDVDVLGRDPLNDVAFLKINGAKDLTPAELGDSKTVRIGQQVVAIGNALGQYKNTVTSGIISGTGRSVTASSDGTSRTAEELTDLIQTDAAINSGNSGGPLVNMAGQVIGINTAIAQDANNVGFVIPISSTKGTLASVLSSGKVQRPYIGVRYVNITPDVKQEYKLPVGQGAYIMADRGSAVVSGGPADKAGIKDKDIITKVNNIEVGEKGSVSTLVGEYKVGDTIELTVLRDGKTIVLKVTLAAYES